MVRNKIYSDSVCNLSGNTRVSATVKEGENVNDVIRENSPCKVLFTVCFHDSEFLVDLNKDPELQIGLLTEKNIDQIEVVLPDDASMKYRQHGACGAVRLHTSDKKSIALLRK